MYEYVELIYFDDHNMPQSRSAMRVFVQQPESTMMVTSRRTSNLLYDDPSDKLYTDT
jgi:hypothetical protein